MIMKTLNYNPMDKSTWDGKPLAEGIFGNMLIQMKLGKVEKIYGVNCCNNSCNNSCNNIKDIDDYILSSIAVFRIVR